MHELAITQSVVDMVAERTDGRQVGLVRLEVGMLSGVVPDAMEFCYELIISGTPLEGSTLVIEQTQGAARCRSCGQDFALNDLILLCPCGSAEVELTAGRELRVVSVELVVEPCA
ncbi:MAG TPA: hydrogenase maturation nickel metallochaperone HypA [Propionibacteriaceae bacterium]|jgi:hydrogenase nickel incorporation protein HypA/HybF|nr:hydrogenase maturation nickel metallochaperone HypA [Propionibacteriaceae bacterium]